jgi:hypothetical protein
MNNHIKKKITPEVKSFPIINTLTNQIKNLTKAINNLTKQHKSLEQSNYRIQVSMLILTVVTTAISISPVVNNIVESIFNKEPVSPITIVSCIISLILGLIIYIICRRIETVITGLSLEDRISVKDKLSYILKDSKGNIKKERR